ncbi:MAG: GNAT family N-acetyltransferase [Sphingomonas sp.]|uniref:GNAT family N-acetyltransferase n=1 Tax=Sphingomonas sp. TaxID=28214 RepID=UPI0025CF8F27|nr:GNAT family N-acetyltransferase [Sphingomonas sp.]MBX3564534.1 GNAT family N-acetyltransferase [Sphingomonas sp.]
MPDIRVATIEDLPGLHPMVERAYRGEPARGGWTHEADLITEGARTDLETLGAIIEDPEQRLLIAEQDDAVIGCVQVSNRGKGLAYIGLLAVDPALQAGGLGRKLLEAAERVARNVFDARRVEMTVIDRREELIAWYRRRGYLPSGETRDFPIALDPPLFMSVLVKPLL